MNNPTTPALNETFGLPNEPVEKKYELTVAPTEPTTLEQDTEFVKGHLANLMVKGDAALEMLSSIASAEQSPRSFEVVATMINTLSEVAMKIIVVHEKKAKLTAPVEGNNTQINNLNVAFVGTTKDLQQMIREINSKTIDMDNDE